MPSKHAAIALFDIRDNAKLAQEFAAGLSVDAFKADRRTFYAVTRCLEIISEAARRLPPSVTGILSCHGAPLWASATYIGMTMTM